MASRRALSVAGLGGSAAVLAAAAGAAWYYASRITELPGARVEDGAEADRVELVGADAAHLRLSGPAAARPGWWGVRWDGGYARVGPPTSSDGPVVHRPLEQLTGAVRAGVTGALDAWAVAPDPRALPVVGEQVTEVSVPGPLGDLPAWWFPGGSDTWAVLVHGRSGTRRETLRLVPALQTAGLPALAVSYRNDPDAPPSPDGRSHLGATEWEDVAAAVSWALDHGARDVLLVGMSMGGACAGELLARSPLAPRVRALVLDAPVLDWGPVIRRAAIERGLPDAVLGLLLPPSMALAGRRGAIDWAGLRHLHSPQDFDRPILLVHGTEDAVVPVELADALAAAREDVVTYLRVEGAGHLCSWNVAREDYERALVRFAHEVGAAAPGSPRPAD